MEWINNHLGAAAGLALATTIAFAVFWAAPKLWAAWKVYRDASKAFHQTQERLADGYQDLTTLTDRQLIESRRESEELKLETKELRRALADQVRATLVREEINRQALALTRALKGRMRENRIDYSDIDESIQRQFGNEQ